MTTADRARSILSRREVLAVGAAGALAAALPFRTIGAISAIAGKARPLEYGYWPAALVVIVLRGGADAFSVCFPHADAQLAALRPDLLPGTRGSHGRCERLDERYSLTPAMAPLAEVFRRRNAAIVLGTGLEGGPRAHGPALTELSQAVNSPDALVGADSGKSLTQRVIRAGDRLQHERDQRLCVLVQDGYDTHADQAVAGGTHDRSLRDLADACRAFHERFIAGPEPSHRIMRLLVVTEFGRTLGQNARGGTDHGEGSAAIVLGSCLPFRTVDGGVPDLSGRSWSDGLPVTTDLRDVIRRAANSAMVVSGS